MEEPTHKHIQTTTSTLKQWEQVKETCNTIEKMKTTNIETHMERNQ